MPDQLFSKIPETVEDLTGRIYIVTGANSGIGLATATHLASMNPERLILAVRDMRRGETAKAQILEETGYDGARVEVWMLDMASFASVSAFAERVDSELKRLDGAVLNAGVHLPTWRTTADGWETILQINTIATGLLGVLLLPILSKTASLPFPQNSARTKIEPHLTMVASVAQYMGIFEERKLTADLLKTLNTDTKTDFVDRYPTSKLLLNLQTRELAALPAARNVVVNLVDPGLCVTNIANEYNLSGWVTAIWNFFGWPPSKGAWNIMFGLLKTTPPAAFITSCEIRKDTPWSYTPAAARIQALHWKESVDVWKAASPRAAEILEAESGARSGI
uniref:Short-chain dehydrogenase/reductase family protein n=1 Tax=Mycena chlorophos TaxID=658473 RepID=A0ABQ0M8M3_MYCCL|nr:short-chain dehydrogenase/reductase family protein [Mycena chlorophos]